MLTSMSGCLEDGIPHGGVLSLGASFVYFKVRVKHEEGSLVGKAVGLSALIVASFCRDVSYNETFVK